MKHLLLSIENPQNQDRPVINTVTACLSDDQIAQIKRLSSYILDNDLQAIEFKIDSALCSKRSIGEYTIPQSGDIRYIYESLSYSELVLDEVVVRVKSDSFCLICRHDSFLEAYKKHIKSMDVDIVELQTNDLHVAQRPKVTFVGKLLMEEREEAN
ncbi:hypothetical protein [Neptuniibacter sp. QD37_11]|uniref:hypothetical protein n=1 Tax=Neptuniibacter sp. QD37_11 TaxID=3398209 RepID=UPI0039F4EA26